MDRNLKPIDRECETIKDFSNCLRDYLTKDNLSIDDMAERMFVKIEVTPLAVHLHDYSDYSRNGHRHNVLVGQWKYHTDTGLFVRFGHSLSLINQTDFFTNWSFTYRGDTNNKGFLNLQGQLSYQEMSRMHALCDIFTRTLEGYRAVCKARKKEIPENKI